MRSLRHWTPTYIVNRYKYFCYFRKRQDAPWLCPSVIGVLETYFRPDDVGIEFGSGRSTLWFAKQVAHVTSVESSPEWADRVVKTLEENGYSSKVDMHLHSIQPVVEGDRTTYPYVQVAESLPDASLDFALVDGIDLRGQCVLAVIPKLRSGGLLIIDNIERYIPNSSIGPEAIKEGYADEYWQEFGEKTKDWRYMWFGSGVTDTVLYFKP